ncbi:uncharacterized protein LOC125942261 [Dermacentor silvarum]|uniref:uncharacterized protein LOC125942261 n=1 Tax=Dermacentor silvarum TaxID=543639 RepID=UPI002100EB60|nr:uncharacterized protein LOC125942261 [Dermacentor silvarum]
MSTAKVSTRFCSLLSALHVNNRVLISLTFICAVALELIQKRWKSLRDKFRRIFNGRILSQKSGAGADDVESVDTAWPYFQLLLFLRDTMVTRPTSGNYALPESPRSEQLNEPLDDSQQQSSSASSILMGIAQFQDQDLEARSDISDISGLASASQVSSPASTSTLTPASTSSTTPASTSSTTPASTSSTTAASTSKAPAAAALSIWEPAASSRALKERKRRTSQEVMVTEMGQLSKTLQACPLEDEYYHMALNIGKFLKKVPEERQLDFQIELFQLIKKYSE